MGVKYRDYVAENFRATVPSLERGDMIGQVIAAASSILLGGLVTTFVAQNWPGLDNIVKGGAGVLAALVFLFAFVTPYRMWKAKISRIEELEANQQKNLRVMAGQADRYWWTKSGPTIWQIFVKNVSAATSISGVWVTVNFKGAGAEKYRWPQTLLSKDQRIDPGQNRPWKVFELVNGVDGWWMRLEAVHGGQPLHLPLGTYQLAIEVGGLDAAAVKYGYTLTLLDSTNLTLVKDYGPPEDDDAPRSKSEKAA